MIRSRKLLDAACNEPCIKCMASTPGKTVAAHYEGMRSPAFGKGKSIKPHDIAAAHLCDKCHADFDARRAGIDQNMELMLKNPHAYIGFFRKVIHSEEFLFRIMLTVIKLMAQGKLVVVDEN